MSVFMKITDLNNCFFDQGIRFQCQRCGACCSGEPGTIYVDTEEIKTIADFLGISRALFKHRYLYPFRDSYSIREDKDGHCLFHRHRCIIYPVRPQQCRTYPFWLSNLRRERNWREVCRQCPGIGKGPLFTKDEILEAIRSNNA